MASRRTQVVFDQWETYISQWNDKPVFVSFDVEAAEKDLTHTLAHCARVLIPIREPNQNGGPTSPESEYLYQLEDELCGSLSEHGIRCRLVGRLTCDGMRELVFQLDDWDSFRPPVGMWMGEHEDYQIDVSEHEGWNFFNDCIRPTPEVWLYLADRRTIEHLVKAGSNPDRVHALEFFFDGDERALQQAAQSLQQRGYAPGGAPNFADGKLMMVKRMPLDEQAICDESAGNQVLAEQHGIAYSGWGAAVVR